MLRVSRNQQRPLKKRLVLRVDEFIASGWASGVSAAVTPYLIERIKAKEMAARRRRDGSSSLWLLGARDEYDRDLRESQRINVKLRSIIWLGSTI